MLTRNAAAISASTTHGTQRSDGDEPDGLSPLPPEPGLPVDRSGGRLVSPGRQPGGGVGGRPFGPGRPLASGSFPGRRSDGSDGRRLMELPELLGGDPTMLRPRGARTNPGPFGRSAVRFVHSGPVDATAGPMGAVGLRHRVGLRAGRLHRRRDASSSAPASRCSSSCCSSPRTRRSSPTWSGRAGPRASARSSPTSASPCGSADAAWFFVGVGLQLVSLIPTQLLRRGARRSRQAGRRAGSPTARTASRSR